MRTPLQRVIIPRISLSLQRALIPIIALAILAGSCTREKPLKHEAHVPGTETTIDSALAPLLKPVNQRILSDAATIKPESGTRIFSLPVQGIITYDTRSQSTIASRVAGRIEKLYIHYNYQQVKKGQLIMEIYSPDLAAAQRELLFIAQNDQGSNMLERAKQKLLLLGMTPAQVNRVLSTKRIQYNVPVYSRASGYILEPSSPLPASNATSMEATTNTAGDGMGMNANATTSNTNTAEQLTSTPLLIREGQYVNAGQSLFNLYNDQQLVAEFSFDPTTAASLKQGQQLVFSSATNTNTVYSGTIGLIQPTYKQGNSFTMARVYLKNSKLKPGQLLNAKIPVSGQGYWLPSSAVIKLGSRSVIFKKEGKVFIPKNVRTGFTAQGRIMINEEIGDWNIAEHAAYLVDSDSFINGTANEDPSSTNNSSLNQR